MTTTGGMTLQFTEEQNLLRKTVAQFVEKEVAPIADESDRKGIFPRDVRRVFETLM
mgnify:FL=1